MDLLIHVLNLKNRWDKSMKVSEKFSERDWEKVNSSQRNSSKISRPSLTYAKDSWRRLKKNKLSMLGLIILSILLVMAIICPMLSKYSYSDQDLSMANIASIIKIHNIGDRYVYLHSDYKLYDVNEKDIIERRLDVEEEDLMNRRRIYQINGSEVVVDYSFAAKAKKSGDKNAKKYEIRVNNEIVNETKTILNKAHIFGTDALGRDVFIRVIYGARVSLLIAFVATLVNFFIGVMYGGISGYFGGNIDNIMMRFVDIISTIPLVLYVILIAVIRNEPGLETIIIAIGLVFWVRMARIVRGQVLSIKEQEYILAARNLGASTPRILIKHLTPNAMGPIIVSLAMMIPSAIFTEAFLSFIGIGVSVPMASWGTLANEALGGLRSYPYQLFYPAFFISITVLSFNFLGDGLRDALDPRLRK